MTLFDSPQGQALTQRASRLRQQRIASMLAQDSDRAATFSCEAAGLHLDFSRHLLDTDALELLLALARRADISGNIEALLNGQEVNTTEGRPALHTLLRASGAGDGSRAADVAATRGRMRAWVEALREGGMQDLAASPFAMS